MLRGLEPLCSGARLGELGGFPEGVVRLWNRLSRALVELPSLEAFKRSVYDGEEHGRFMEKLEARIRNHDREIEKMCNFHYQGFVDSITELLKVRGEAQKLKNQVTDTNRKLQNEGKELIIAMEELKQCRLQQRNISATVDKLTLCLPVLEMYSKLREQMKSKRHYPALKTLEHLEHTYLPQVSHYRFCKIMVDNIPKLREEIKEVSMSDLKDFLESIRKHSDKIGETAMKQVCLGFKFNSDLEFPRFVVIDLRMQVYSVPLVVLSTGTEFNSIYWEYRE
ncbi:exocyst complex component 6B-like protein [Pitangus sulphuratus]|nr:exocyst complex component 6B-like protein [Pitangus sulphuratus]